MLTKTVAALCSLASTRVLGDSSVSDTDFSGLHVARDDGGVALGADGDVTLVRSGANQLTIDASITALGDLSIAGNTTFVTHDGTVMTLADLHSMIASLSSTVSDNTETIADNSDSITAYQDAIVTLQDEVAVLLSSVDPYSTRVVYESAFGTSATEWIFDGADLATTTCDGYTVLGGNLGSGDSVSLYLDDISAHSQLTFQLTFVVIDSWDTETAVCTVDDVEVWTETFVYSDSSIGDVCGSGSWGEQFIDVEFDIEHYMQGVAIDFTSTLDSDYSDESWGLADFKISSKLAEGKSLVYASAFAQNDAAGWKFTGGADAQTTTCGDLVILGGYDVLGQDHSVVKTISDLPDHTELIVAFEFLKVCLMSIVS